MTAKRKPLYDDIAEPVMLDEGQTFFITKTIGTLHVGEGDTHYLNAFANTAMSDAREDMSMTSSEHRYSLDMNSSLVTIIIQHEPKS